MRTVSTRYIVQVKAMAQGFLIILKVHSPLRSNPMVWDECFCHIPDFHIMIVILSPWCRCYIGDEHGDQHVCPCQCDHCQAVCDESQTVWHSKSNSWKTISSKQFQYVPMVKVVPPRACCTPGNADEKSAAQTPTSILGWISWFERFNFCFLLLFFAVILVIVTIFILLLMLLSPLLLLLSLLMLSMWHLFWELKYLIDFFEAELIELYTNPEFDIKVKWNHHWLHLMINMVRCSKWTCYHKYKNIDEYWIQLAGMKTSFSLETERGCVWVLLCCYASLTKFIFVHGLFVSPGTLSYSRPYLSLCSGTQSVQ